MSDGDIARLVLLSWLVAAWLMGVLYARRPRTRAWQLVPDAELRGWVRLLMVTVPAVALFIVFYVNIWVHDDTGAEARDRKPKEPYR